VTASPEEALWVLRAQQGDREALELLLRRVQPALLRYLRGIVGPDDADDLVQDVLVLVFRKLRWLHAPELFRPWAFRIASRTAFRHLKRRNRRPPHLDDEALDAMAGEVTPSSRDSQEVLEALLGADEVSPASRAVLLLHYREEMTLPEVAAVLELPIGTIRSRLAYGLNTLRKLLAQKGLSDVGRYK